MKINFFYLGFNTDKKYLKLTRIFSGSYVKFHRSRKFTLKSGTINFHAFVLWNLEIKLFKINRVRWTLGCRTEHLV